MREWFDIGFFVKVGNTLALFIKQDIESTDDDAITSNHYNVKEIEILLPESFKK